MTRYGVLKVVGLTMMMSLCLFGVRSVAADEAAKPEAAEAQAAALDDAAQASSDWSFAIDATYNSKYVWRGINTVNGSVFQPSVTVGYKGLSANIWGNMDISDVNGYSGHFTELDYTLSYGWDCGDMWSFGLGAIYYRFPNTGFPDTTEIYGSATLNTLLSPTLTVYRDVDESEGTYVSLGVSHSFEDVWTPAENVSMGVDLSAAVGYGSSNNNSYYFGVNHSSINDVLVSVGLPFQMGEHWTLTPSLNCSSLIGSDIRRASAHDDNIWGGLTLSCSF